MTRTIVLGVYIGFRIMRAGLGLVVVVWDPDKYIRLQ